MKWQPISQVVGESFVEQMNSRSIHQLLAVPDLATDAELARAYRRFVSRYHPDRLDPFLRPHADRLMRLVNSAYDRERNSRAD